MAAVGGQFMEFYEFFLYVQWTYKGAHANFELKFYSIVRIQSITLHVHMRSKG
jgi:hypothetical protein